MKKFRIVATRLAQVVIILVLVTFGITVLVRLLPGDPASTYFPYATPEELKVLRREYGTDKNLIAYYIDWVAKVFRGDFGYYYSVNGGKALSVTAMWKQAMPVSLWLMFYTVVFSLLCAIPIAMITAFREGSRVDRIVSNLLFGFSAIPNFAIGLGLVFIFAVQFGLVNPVGYHPWHDGAWLHFKSMVLPVLSLSVGQIAAYTRLLRADLIATLKEDFVAMASSKGLSNRWILWRHVFRPSSLTLLTTAALNMGALIGGAVIIEVVFALNGLGMFLQASIAQRQYLAVQSTVALVAAAFILFNVCADILYGVLDPRVRAHRGR